MTSARKKSLKVFFDTNVIYTVVASDLFKSEISDFLANPINDPQLDVTWFIPEVVRAEREFQMNTRATELLPSLNKLERVMGHQLGINGEVIRDRISSTIQRELSKHKVNVATLDATKVPWDSVIEAAVKRKPPFQLGEKEKGFRDAVIIETFAQEVNKSPKSASICLLAFVSEDDLVCQAVTARTSGSSNVRVLGDLDELKNLINTLASEVSEDYVEEMRAKAAPLFWTNVEDKSTLYFTAGVGAALKEQFSKDLGALPDGITRIETKMNYVTPTPNFLKKTGQTLHWVTKLRVEQHLFKPTKLQQLQDLASANSPSKPAFSSGLLSLGTAKDEPVETRNLIFYASWTTRVNAKKKVSSARLEKLVIDTSATEIKSLTEAA